MEKVIDYERIDTLALEASRILARKDMPLLSIDIASWLLDADMSALALASGESIAKEYKEYCNL